MYIFKSVLCINVYLKVKLNDIYLTFKGIFEKKSFQNSNEYDFSQKYLDVSVLKIDTKLLFK